MFYMKLNAFCCELKVTKSFLQAKTKRDSERRQVKLLSQTVVRSESKMFFISSVRKDQLRLDQIISADKPQNKIFDSIEIQTIKIQTVSALLTNNVFHL